MNRRGEGEPILSLREIRAGGAHGKAVKSQFIQSTGVALTLVLILGALAMVWAGIIGLFLWAFLLFSSFGGDQASLVLS